MFKIMSVEHLIQFRQPIINKETGEFIEWHYWGFMGEKDRSYISPTLKSFTRARSNIRIGLTDRNSIDIYTDDILEIEKNGKKWLAVVRYNLQGASFHMEWQDGSVKKYMEFISCAQTGLDTGEIRCDNIEVVANLIRSPLCDQALNEWMYWKGGLVLPQMEKESSISEIVQNKPLERYYAHLDILKKSEVSDSLKRKWKDEEWKKEGVDFMFAQQIKEKQTSSSMEYPSMVAIPIE